jgi:hypothetical protein
MAYDAVLRNLAVIGEAVWALPGEFNAEGFYTPHTDKRLELTASGPTPDRETLSTLRDRGAHRALVWLPQDTAGAIRDSDTEQFLDDHVRD